MTRALATIDTISRIEPHPDAYRLDLATVRNWRCVVGRGEFKEGEAVVFIEPDAFLPEGDQRWDFLMPRGTKTLPDGTRGHVLRTARLRGVVSQGLVLKHSGGHEVGEDVTEALGIRLYEPVVPVTADIIGPFPEGVIKTDEERIQNFTPERWSRLLGSPRVEVTEKIDGTSITVLMDDDGIRIFGRNWELSPGCGTYRLARTADAVRWFAENGRVGHYIQGELSGAGVQGNPLKLNHAMFHVFNVGRAGGGWRGDPAATHPFVGSRLVISKVPVRDWFNVKLLDIPEAIQQANGLTSVLNRQRQAEGVVVRGYSGNGVLIDSVKIINNRYLLKGER